MIKKNKKNVKTLPRKGKEEKQEETKIRIGKGSGATRGRREGRQAGWVEGKTIMEI